MDETSNSLLGEIKASSDERAWDRLIACYTPFIRAILLRKGLGRGDLDDVIQNVLTVVVRRVSEFERQRTGSFRTWLRAICSNCLRDYWRAYGRSPLATGDSKVVALLNELNDPESDLSRFWEEQHDQYVLEHLLELVRHDFKPSTYEAFRRLALNNESVDEVAQDLGISVNAAFVARSRVMKRLREKGAGLMN